MESLDLCPKSVHDRLHGYMDQPVAGQHPKRVEIRLVQDSNFKRDPVPPLRSRPDSAAVAGRNFADKCQKLIEQLGSSELFDLYRSTVCIWSKGDILKLTGRQVPSGVFERIFGEAKQEAVEHQTQRSNHQHRIWALLMWELWREKRLN